MTIKKFLLLSLIALITGLGALAAAEPTAGEGDSTITDKASDDEAPTQSEARKRLEFLLSGYEYFPTRETLDEVAEAPVIIKLLQTMAHEDELRPTLRLRAVDALSLYGGEGEEVTQFLLAVIALNPDAVERSQLRVVRLMRHRAMNSVAKIKGDEAAQHLVPFLDDEDLQIRLTAISALGQFGGSAGQKALRDLKTKDTNPAVQREINKHL
ncbi:MAG: HEAT repeat domain-containing protein [Bradymonadaceae bacterium]